VPEALALDPVEFAPERVELLIPGENDLGAPFYLKADGLDYGESSAQLEMVRRAIGEGATDRRWPNIECTIPLVIRGDRDIPLATAINELESKVGLIQRENGGSWIRRDFDLGGEFAGSVGCPVHNAALPGLQGWMMANKQVLTDVQLKLMRSPFWYATTEIEAAEVKGSEIRDLQFTIAEVLGTAPGLIRIRFKNENKEADLRGLICALESRDYRPGATAELAYEAEALTPMGGATIVSKTGASGGKVVEHASLTAGWLTVLGSEIAGVGHMQHVGVRRMKFRVYDPNSETGQVQMKLEWRPLGATSWSDDSGVVTAPLVGNYVIVDLGECRPERAVVGNERWEWRLLARAPGGSGAIRIDQVWIAPVEQFLELSTPYHAPAAGAQSTRSPATVVNAIGIGTIPWTNPADATLQDGNYSFAALGKEGTATTNYLEATNFGFELPLNATVTGIVVQVKRRRSAAAGAVVADNSILLVKGGKVQSSANKASLEPWPVSGEVAVYGGSADRWDNTWTEAAINSSGFGVVVVANLTDIGFGCNAEIDSIAVTVYYTQAPEENKVCFATRSAEVAFNGSRRQHPTDEVWGDLIPEGGGFNLYAPPSALEGRPLRGIICPTQGDLGELADAGSNNGSAQVFVRSAYLFAREAA
jgi:hypothetical protein